MKNHKRKTKILLLLVLAAVCLGIAVTAVLILEKKWKPNTRFAAKYNVTGVDVSHYQGEIDWEKMEPQGIDFAFIKATEGSSHVDEQFSDNWEKAAETDLYVGAYHFFSFESPAETQAQRYVNTVGTLSGKLAPVIDIEYYGKYDGSRAGRRPEKEDVIRELGEMLVLLEEQYGVKPIIYTTYQVYHRYIKGEFEEYPLWIRNVYYSPNVDMDREWAFWQYSDTALLEGYNGREKYIDMNVFSGDEEALRTFLVP